MDDLVEGKPALAKRVRESPHWKSWEELVTLVRFVLRHRFSRSTDPAEVQRLYDSWMRSVEKVPQWRGYWKPKHHLGDHLSDALDEHGPFRAYWCMWGEAFLQYLKRLFEVPQPGTQTLVSPPSLTAILTHLLTYSLTHLLTYLLTYILTFRDGQQQERAIFSRYPVGCQSEAAVPGPIPSRLVP